MNKKQLAVAWAVAIIFTYVAYTQPMSDFIRIGSSTLIIGVLLIYTLKGPKR